MPFVIRKQVIYDTVELKLASADEAAPTIGAQINDMIKDAMEHGLQLGSLEIEFPTEEWQSMHRGYLDGVLNGGGKATPAEGVSPSKRR